MDLRPGYKRTELGMIPRAWEVKRLDELGAWKGGMTPSTQNPSFWLDGNVPWISSGDVKSAVLSQTGYSITASAVRQGATTLLPAKSIVVVTRSGILRKYLPVAMNAIPMAINQDIKALIPTEKLCSAYLLHALIGNGGRILARCLKAGTTVESIEFPWLKAFTIPLPSLPEQRAIAEALSDVDALIGALDRLIAKKRDLKQAAMQQLLTGHTRLPGFRSDWEVKRLGGVLKVRHGKSQRDVVADDGPYPVLASGGQIGRAMNYLYDKPSVLIGRKGTIDSPQYVDSPFWTVDTLFFTEISGEADPKFIFFLFNTINWYSYNEASGVPSLNASTIEDIEVQLPPVPEQAAIAKVLSDMDTELAALEQRRDKTRALKQGMMQELLTGRTRLV